MIRDKEDRRDGSPHPSGHQGGARGAEWHLAMTNFATDYCLERPNRKC